MVPPPAQQQQKRPSGPHCTAVYDFVPENPGELAFKVRFPYAFYIIGIKINFKKDNT